MNIDVEKIGKAISKLSKKAKNKSVIIYATGQYFQAIDKEFDLKEKFNIIGVSDGKFTPEDEGQEFLGYKMIPKTKIDDYNPDFVLIAAVSFWEILEDFISDAPKDSKTTYLPLVTPTIWELIKQLFSNN